MKLLVIDRQGFAHSLDADTNRTVMEIIRDNVYELQALCGGACSCATCHVHVDPAWADRLQPISQDESDLLDGSSHRDATSRLACQLRLPPGLTEVRVTIAQEH